VYNHSVKCQGRKQAVYLQKDYRLFVLEGEASSFRVVEEKRDLALAKVENLKQLFREKSDEVNQLLRDMAENIAGYKRIFKEYQTSCKL